ncbi:alcohol oxidase [Fusarium beomiforme]|uniref:Alcohol oxidase n=1 Tax=Fusarium beomiforme TaxID=44412 RepID=A0A9P5ABG1_9HYPO|nr:alcohol oxidase [Fusarium beomiforme]
MGQSRVHLLAQQTPAQIAIGNFEQLGIIRRNEKIALVHGKWALDFTTRRFGQPGNVDRAGQMRFAFRVHGHAGASYPFQSHIFEEPGVSNLLSIPSCIRSRLYCKPLAYMASSTYDYIVVGGGLAGCVLSSRVRLYDNTAKVLLVEAGKDTRERSDVHNMQIMNLGGELDWQYESEPVAALLGRRITLNSGKGLGGSSAINSGGWTRGAAADYDEWASLVGDERYSYEGLLPWFKKSEHWFDDKNPDQHGQDGPIHVTCAKASNRMFPLAEPAAAGWEELGVSTLPDGDQNTGDNLGRAYICEARSDGKREWAANRYPLDGVEVCFETFVNRVILQKLDGSFKATGVELADGSVINGKNIILSAGALRSPQILQLSGIGPGSTLQEHGIEPLVDLPDVGQNLSDHMLFFQHWRLRDPSAGHTIGSTNPLFQEPQYSQGVPYDWIITTGVPQQGLAEAIEKDEGTKPDKSSHALLAKERTFLENIVLFAKIPFPGVSMDAEHITSAVSGKPSDHPKVNLNYLSTEVDKYVFREGLRQLTRFMLESKFAENIVGESVPEGLPVEALALDDNDEKLDQRIAMTGGAANKSAQANNPASAAVQVPSFSCTFTSSIARVRPVEYIRHLELKVANLEAQLTASTSRSNDYEPTAGPSQPLSGSRDTLDSLVGPADDLLSSVDGSETYHGAFASLNVLRIVRDKCDSLANIMVPLSSGRLLAEAFSRDTPLVSGEQVMPPAADLPELTESQRLCYVAIEEALTCHECIDREDFFAQLTRVHAKPSEEIDPSDRAFLALVFALLAFAKRYEAGAQSNRVTILQGWGFYQSSMEMLQLDDPCSLNMLRAIVYQVLFLAANCMLSKAYTRLSIGAATAIRLGLHVPSPSLGPGRHLPVEHMFRRRQVFSALYGIDTYIASTLGMPKLFHQVEADQLLPLRDEDLHDHGISFVRRCPHTPEAESFVGYRIVAIMAEIHTRRHPFSKGTVINSDSKTYGMTIQEVTSLDEELTDWYNSLPPVDQIPPLKRALHAQLVIRHTYAASQMSLHRPFLHHLIRKADDPSFCINGYACGSRCITAAMQTVW